MNRELTSGNVTGTMLVFAGPMIAGNLLQQCYNIADTLVVGKCLGAGALASVGAAYTLMTFLTSVLIGLCMGSSSVTAFYYGKKDYGRMREAGAASFVFIGAVSAVMNVLVFLWIDWILRLLCIPADLGGMMRDYVWIIFGGIFFVFLYNYFAFFLRALGNSLVPLIFLGAAAILNIVLDILFVAVFPWGIEGAAFATVLSQAAAGAGIGVYAWVKEPLARFGKKEMVKVKERLPEIVRFSLASSVQQSVMNFGILMAAFAVAVKIDSFAYMPAQEFANAFSLFISQNKGAGEKKRVSLGVKSAVRTAVLFCLAVSAVIFAFAPQLMGLFVRAGEHKIVAVGAEYLRIEGSFYCGIGILFLLYGYYRGIGKPEMSVVLTVISLGTRVLLAYALAPVPAIGVLGIWWAIPVGWFLADATGLLYLRKCR